MGSINNKVRIVPFEDRFAADFKNLNLEWLEKYNLLESADLQYLDNPQKLIIDKGGRILIAIIDGDVVGTCSIIKETESTAELAKLAVIQSARGKGIGKLLIKESIEQGKELGFCQLTLVSNTKLATAISLYESFGFKHEPLPENIVYQTADVYMVLGL